MGTVDTPWDERIHWRAAGSGGAGEGTSRFGRYIHTRNEDGTIDVEFVARNGPVEVLGRRLTEVEAYHVSVEHNKKLLGITGGGSEPGPARRRRQDHPVCPQCWTTHPPSECP